MSTATGITTQQQVPGITTVNGPAALLVGDYYYLAWRGSDGTSLCWASCPSTDNGEELHSYDWTDHHAIADVGTSEGPALASFKGKIYLAWKGEGDDVSLYLSSMDPLPGGGSWRPQLAVPGVGGTSDRPALAATDDALYLAWKGEPGDDRIFWTKSSDGENWAPQQPVPGVGGTSNGPALAAYRETLYLAWKAEPGDDRIFYSKCTDGSTWSPQAVVQGEAGTSITPALGAGNTGNLHMAWRGQADPRIYTNLIQDGGTPQSMIPNVETSDSPAIATQPAGNDAPILLAWRGADDQNVYVGPLDALAAQQPPPQPVLFWATGDIGFGSGANNANFNSGLTLDSNGNVNFAGTYQDTGSIPIFSAPAQNYSVAAVVIDSNRNAYTFTHSKNDVPTGGAIDAWGPEDWLNSLNPQPHSKEVVPVTSHAEIANNWDSIVAAQLCHFRATNSSELGPFLDSLIHDLEEALGYALTAVSILAS